MIKQNLHKIIQDLIEVVGEKGLKVNSDVIFEQACSYHRGELMNQNRNQQNKTGSLHSGIIDGTVQTGSADNTPTFKQLEFLKNNGVKVNPNLTKQEATIMIGNFKKSLQKENI
jgi:hypothetical protein